MNLFIIQLLPALCDFLPLRFTYIPQHPILEHPQPTFFPQQWGSCFTPAQNNWENVTSVYLYLNEFRQQTKMQTVLDQMITGNPHISSAA